MQPTPLQTTANRQPLARSQPWEAATEAARAAPPAVTKATQARMVAARAPIVRRTLDWETEPVVRWPTGEERHTETPPSLLPTRRQEEVAVREAAAKTRA